MPLHAITHLAHFALHLPAHQNYQLICCIQPSKLHSYPQFVQDSHEQLTSSYATATPSTTPMAEMLTWCGYGYSESFQVGDKIWLHTLIVIQSCTRKFASFWRGSYTVINKPSEVTYKIQLIGGSQILVVHRNRMKPCLPYSRKAWRIDSFWSAFGERKFSKVIDQPIDYSL